MDLSCLEGLSITGAWLRGVGRRRRKWPSGDPGLLGRGLLLSRCGRGPGEGPSRSHFSGRKKSLVYREEAWIRAKGLGFQSPGHLHLHCDLA